MLNQIYALIFAWGWTLKSKYSHIQVTLRSFIMMWKTLIQSDWVRWLGWLLFNLIWSSLTWPVGLDFSENHYSSSDLIHCPVSFPWNWAHVPCFSLRLWVWDLLHSVLVSRRFIPHVTVSVSLSITWNGALLIPYQENDLCTGFVVHKPQWMVLNFVFHNFW